MIELLSYEFMQRAFIASIIISLSVGILSPFIVLRRLSLIGEGLAHVAFAGIALAFLLQTPILITTLLVVLFASLLIRKLLEKNVYGDAAIALVLSFGVGAGIIIIGATRGFGVDLFSFLLGSIVTVRTMDIVLFSVLFVFLLSFVFYFWRPLFLLTFQRDIASMQFRHTRAVDMIFSIFIACTVLMAIQVVGILLVTALLVIPGLIGLTIGRSFMQSILYSVFFAFVSMVSGIIISFYYGLPASGVIVMVLFFSYLALFFGFKR